VILSQETKQRRKLFQEYVDAGFYYMRMHNDPDNEGTPFRQTHSKKRLLKAIYAMLEFLGENKVVKMKKATTTYKVSGPKETRLVHIISKE
jgi:hypothetical protein